jgi:hypothetical protein
VYAAIANLGRKDASPSATPAIPRHILVHGVALLFFFLASYYYTVVSYYFTTIRAIVLLKVPAMSSALYELSSVLRVFPFSGKAGRFFYLLSPCLFPLTFYSLSLTGVWTVAMQRERQWPKFGALVLGLALQVVAFMAYAWVPFTESWKTISSLP